MPTVLVTGGSGLVGSYLTSSQPQNFTWLAPDSKSLNITNKLQTDNYVANHEFDCCLHLAAYTNVDQAEKNKELCHKINVLGTSNLFEAVSRKHKPFILISTDFVFDGQQPFYDETSVPHPINYYGQTKYEAEQMVKDQAMIIRLSYPYGSSNQVRPDFVQTIYQRLKEELSVQGITDATFTPTWLGDIAKGLVYFINHYQIKTFHLVGSQSLSPYEAFKHLAKVFGLDQRLIIPTSFNHYFQNKAKRPKHGVIKSRYQLIKTQGFWQGLQLVKELSS